MKSPLILTAQVLLVVVSALLVDFSILDNAISSEIRYQTAVYLSRVEPEAKKLWDGVWAD